MPIKNPPHPGDFIKMEIVEAYGMSVTAAALGVSRPTLSSLLNGKAGLSGEMALRIEKAFGGKRYTPMRMQSANEIAQTRKREKTIRVQRVGRRLDLMSEESQVSEARLGVPGCRHGVRSTVPKNP